ncbi:hypothetical protein KJ934_02270 [Patescibacteria group bacterium]|nr:hypothetical protein [Patescibacteria group bacterium]MBU4353594.1 hypothetical protein [Patescibacteria group bacterium]MBU4476897.1 hypothetical protein [Patescibacteria group bacterium]MCG2699082.1 hypothetical protein [Candidatus Parcubacteria bacterium]
MEAVKIPKIIIEYNRFLDPIFINYVKSNPEWENYPIPEKENVLERVENYKKEWTKYEQRILLGLCDITGLEFNRDVIDVYIVSVNPRQFSNPIIIKSGFSPDEFVDTLTHELIHRLLVLNKIKKEIIVDNKYFTESEIIKNHIIVHALLKYIYLDILKDNSRLEKNILRSKNHGTNEYTRAWEIVEQEGYKNLIKGFKNSAIVFRTEKM